MPDIEALRADYHRLINSWDYAFAMGAGCTIEGGNVTRFQLVRQRAADLHALIKGARRVTYEVTCDIATAAGRLPLHVGCTSTSA